MKEKDMYTFDELLDNLKIPVSEFCRRAGVTEGTIANIRKGRATRKSTTNKLLGTFSDVYGLDFSLKNVSGLHVENRAASTQKVDAEKPATPPVSASMPSYAIEGEVHQICHATRNPGGAPITDIPAELPLGTVKLIDFIEAHGLLQGSVSRWMNAGIRGEKIETTKIDRPNGPGVQHFFTPTQQEKALDFLRRHGKLKASQPEPEEQPGASEHPWWSPDGE